MINGYIQILPSLTGNNFVIEFNSTSQSHKPDINGKTNNGWFPLSQAAWHGLTSVVAKLGRMPALRGVNDQGGLFERTPLNLATTQGKESKGAMVGLLL